jgi:hypothetical protein
MRKTPSLRFILLAAVTTAPLLVAGRAQAGVTLVTQRGTDTPSTMYLDGDKMRMEHSGGKERTVVVDAANKRVLMINELERTYSEMTEADLKRIGEMVAARRAQMQERMKSMPPEQRKRMEALMGGKDSKPSDLKFERMGAKKTINGFSCEMYRVLQDGTPREEDCIAPWNSSQVQKSDFAGLRKFADEMVQQTGSMSSGAGRHMIEQFDKFPGFPVSRHPLEPGDHQDEQVKSIKRGAIPAEKFAAPAGYTKAPSPMNLLGGPGGPHGMPPQ